MFAGRLTNLRQDIAIRQDTSGDKFIIELDGQETNNRGIAGELILRRAEKLKNRFGDDVRIGRFAGFDLFLRPSFNNTVEVVVRGKNSYAARVTDTALGTIRSLKVTVQSFEERAGKLETDISDAHKRAKELEANVGAQFEHEQRCQHLSRRQSEIEEKLDLTKNQAPSQVEAASVDENEEKNSRTQNKTKRRSTETRDESKRVILKLNNPCLRSRNSHRQQIATGSSQHANFSTLLLIAAVASEIILAWACSSMVRAEHS